MARRADSGLAVALILGGAIAYWYMTTKRSTASPVDANVQAFLATIRHSEGTDKYADPWGTYYGGSQFTDKSDHPAITGEKASIVTAWGPTTAAGAYQIRKTTWLDLGGSAYYGDFSNASQDAAALDLIEGRGATSAVESGDFAGAVALLGKEWASLPGSPYGQPTNTLADLASFYINAGGTIDASGNIA